MGFIETLFSSLHEADLNRRDSLIEQLRVAQTTAIIDELQELLHKGTTSDKCDASEVLCRVDPQKYLNTVTSLLNDNDADIRWHACGLIYDWGDHSYSDLMIRILRSDVDPGVRVLAADCLGRFGGGTAVQGLREASEIDMGIDLLGRSVRAAAQQAVMVILKQV